MPERLRRWERCGLVAILLGLVAYGAVVESRSAYQSSRKTDFGVYARAAWAVRANADIYSVADDNGWHYCYPPWFAVAMLPFADPPADAPRDGYLPYEAGVALWYLLGLFCLAVSVDRFARAVLPDEPAGSRRWWWARMGPVYIVLGGIGFTLGRGQVNLLVVALLAMAVAAWAAKQNLQAGVWLGLAVALKVIPAYLLLYPLIRRDGRGLLGVALAGALTLGVVPVAVWGVPGAIERHRLMFDDVLAPGATGRGDQTRAKELTNTISTDSQSFQAAIHNWRYPDPATRTESADDSTRAAHLALGGFLTLLALVAGRKAGTAADELTFLGTLTALMLLLTPVSHMHYYAYGMPLVAGLWLRGLAETPGAVVPSWRFTVPLVVWGLATATPLFPGETFEFLRQRGLGQLATVGLCAVAWVLPSRKAEVAARAEPLRAAA